MYDLKIAKFGGSSLANADQMRKVKNIVLADKARRYVVPSAPGKRFKDDTKITDSLYKLHAAVSEGKDYSQIYDFIFSRYTGIRDDLGLEIKIEDDLEEVLCIIKKGATDDYAASRGEYLNGKLLAAFLGYDFVDAADVVKFDNRGRYDAEETMRIMPRVLAAHEHAVIPGFYGAMPDGAIKTFSRGGSDVTGAIVAAAVGAELYENWTDVSGFMMADPRIVPHAKKIDLITYRELRELSYMGATVLHEDSIFPVYQAAIPINVKNTNDPENPGTLIVPTIDPELDEAEGITGIAGKKNFSVISIEKNGMNAELGFGRKVLACIEKYSLPFEHMPSSIDTLCVVIENKALKPSLKYIVDDIHRTCQPDSVEVIGELALIATVGRGMIKNVGTAAKVFTALAEANVNVRMIDQGSSELNIIVGVDNKDFDKAVRAIHDKFVN
mgnify:CR=1 FL=1